MAPAFHSLCLGPEGENTSDWQIVWLHGWGQTHASLLRLATFFARRHENILFDLPGFGATAMLAEGADTADYAEALAIVLAAHPAAKRLIVGHSFGCRVATRLAARHPASVDAIVFIGGAGIARDRSVKFRLRARALRHLGKIAGLGDRLFGTSLRAAYQTRFGSADYRNAGPLRGTFVAAVTENLSDAAAASPQPVQLIYGADDTETPPDVGAKFEAAFPDARLDILPGFGHLDILTRGASHCQRLIARFLEDLSQ